MIIYDFGATNELPQALHGVLPITHQALNSLSIVGFWKAKKLKQ